MKCEGFCNDGLDHRGEIVPVVISQNGQAEERWNYCETAIKLDTMAGFTVEVTK